MDMVGTEGVRELNPVKAKITLWEEGEVAKDGGAYNESPLFVDHISYHLNHGTSLPTASG